MAIFLFAVNINTFKVGIQAAQLADKILKGTPAGDIPVISADIFIIINSKATRELEIQVPDRILAMADVIY